MQTIKDARGALLSGATARALEHYEKAIGELQCYRGDPFASVAKALEEAPQFTMAHCLDAYLNLSGTEPPGLLRARSRLAAARELRANRRERAHLGAIKALAAGNFELAGQRFDALLVEHPRDALALQVAHLYDFYRGDARNLRDRPARALRAWKQDDPGYHAVLGMHAFGLEETGAYERAEERARAAMDAQPFDAWAHHALTHCFEMLGRKEDGVRLMAERERFWAEDNFFAVHNWWHWALFHLDLDQTPQVLELYDRRIRGSRSQVALDLVDASALLWRLLLREEDLGARWAELAEAWMPMAEGSHYVFNDLHAIMAFIGAGEWPRVEAQIAEIERWAKKGKGSNRAMARDIGLPLARGFAAFGRGDYAGAIKAIAPVRALAYRIGGSHAQRDVIDLTLIEAARRAGRKALLEALAAERLAVKPSGALTRRYAS